MKAEVQYNDLRGTSAADVSDFLNSSLQNHLIQKYPDFDANRYTCIGCTLYFSDYSVDSVNVDFICKDNQDDNYVRFSPEQSYSYKEAISLFKRFNVVLGGRGIDDIIVNDTINL